MTKKFIDLYNGIVITLTDGRNGKVIGLTVNGKVKKLTQEEVGSLIDALSTARQWLIDINNNNNKKF